MDVIGDWVESVTAGGSEWELHPSMGALISFALFRERLCGLGVYVPRVKIPEVTAGDAV